MADKKMKIKKSVKKLFTETEVGVLLEDIDQNLGYIADNQKSVGLRLDRVESKTDSIFEVVGEMKMDMEVVKMDMEVVKMDMEVVKMDMDVMKVDMDVMKVDMDVMKSDIRITKSDIGEMKSDINEIKQDLVKKADTKDLHLLNQRVTILESK